MLSFSREIILETSMKISQNDFLKTSYISNIGLKNKIYILAVAAILWGTRNYDRD